MPVSYTCPDSCSRSHFMCASSAGDSSLSKLLVAVVVLLASAAGSLIAVFFFQPYIPSVLSEYLRKDPVPTASNDTDAACSPSGDISHIRNRRQQRFAVSSKQIQDCDTVNAQHGDAPMNAMDKPIQQQSDLPMLTIVDNLVTQMAGEQIETGLNGTESEAAVSEAAVKISPRISTIPAPAAVHEAMATESKPLTEEELALKLFGFELPVTCAKLSQLLSQEPATTRALSMVSIWWQQASEQSLSKWHIEIASAMEAMLIDRTPEEDLYTTTPEEDIGKSILELLGYQVVETSARRKTLRILRVHYPISTNFIRAMHSAEPKSCRSALKLLFSAFKDVRLDSSLSDYIDMKVLTVLRTDKCIGTLVAAVLATEARDAATLSSPGAFEKNTILLDIISTSAIVPLSVFNLRGGSLLLPRAACPQSSYFSSMPVNPKPTKLWCPNQNLLLRHTLMIQLNASEILNVLHGILDKAAKQDKNAVIDWFVQVLRLNHNFFSVRGQSALLDDEVSNPQSASSGFILNVALILLNFTEPLLINPEKFLKSIDWTYTLEDSRIEFSKLPNVIDGSKPGFAAVDMDADSKDDDPDDLLLVEKVILSENNILPFATKKVFNFTSEIFWLTMRAMELVDKIQRRRNEQMRRLWDYFNQVKLVYTTHNSISTEVMVDHARQCIHAFHYGWSASQVEGVRFLTLSCLWAKLSSEWLLLQAAEADALTRFYHIPAGMVKSMCDVWAQAARICHETAMPGLLAADAAIFCVELMRRPELAGSPVVQDRLLDVIDTFVRSGDASLIGVVMESEIIRRTLAPALLKLYSKCHAVEALDMNEDTSYDKNSIRSKSNRLIKHLYKYPLDEPRMSIRIFVLHQALCFDDFVISAFYCIIYNFVEAMKILRHNKQNEKLGLAVDSQAMGSVRGGLELSTACFDLLNMLCESEEAVRARMSGPTLRQRVATYVYNCLSYVNSVEKLDALRVSCAEEWGYDEAIVISGPINLISNCLSTPDKSAQQNFLLAFAEHPDFELNGLLRLIDLPGGSALRPFTVIINAVSVLLPGAASSSVPKNAENADEHQLNFDFGIYSLEEAGADDSYSAVWVSEEQVGALDDGFGGHHFFQNLHKTSNSACGANNLRAIMRDYKKTSSMLPTPSRDATIVVRYDGDSPSYCRSFLTGPVDTPYFGGIFVFDIYFPKEFPHVPPQVQFINTGTERFHVNLYECGKVCTSLLGTSIGDTSERWDPGVSSLGQILVSIQSLILGEYHTAAIGRQVTNDNRRLSIDAYAEFRLMTNRYAVNRILQCCRGEGMYSSSFQEFRPIFRRFLFAIRHKLLQSIESYVRDSRTTKTIVNKLLVEVKQLVQEFSLTE